MISQEYLIEKETIIFKDLSDILGPNVHEQSFVFKGFIFGICTKGYIKLKINYNTHHICQNGIFIIIPQHIIHIKECSSDFEMKVMHILPDFLCALPITPDFNLLKQTASTPCLQLQEKDSEEIITLYNIIDHHAKNSDIKKTLTLSLILIITSLFNKNNHNILQPASRQEELTHRFFDLLLQHYTKERNVIFYANKLCITPKYLSMTIKSVTGYSIQKWINEVIIIEAKRYIKTTTYTIQQISEELNFHTSSSFVRFFKQHTGYTPLEYRKR